MVLERNYFINNNHYIESCILPTQNKIYLLTDHQNIRIYDTNFGYLVLMNSHNG